MDELNAYNTYKHKKTALCWCSINIVLTLAYLLEIIKSNRTLSYVITFVVATWIPYVIFIICRKRTKDIYLEYIAGIGYLFFYIFAMATANSRAVFCYIFPMLCILTVYCNKKLNIIVMSSAFIINVISILYGIIALKQTSAADITFDEIQIACMILCTVFLWQSSNVLLLRDNMISALSDRAYYDILTKIHNRTYLDKIEEQHKQNNNFITSLAIIDIDDFKHINDRYGHKNGDAALIYLAEALSHVTKLKDETTPIRFGGDEFIIVSYTQTPEEMHEICYNLSEQLHKNDVVTDKNEKIRMTVSIGIINGKENLLFANLYKKADKALYESKKNGKDKITLIQI